MKKTRILIVLLGLGVISLAPALTNAFSSMPKSVRPLRTSALRIRMANR
jgi:hypothetical protein